VVGSRVMRQFFSAAEVGVGEDEWTGAFRDVIVGGHKY
jgi:hypothetical protein